MTWQDLLLGMLVGFALAPMVTTLIERIPDAEPLLPRPRCRSCAAPIGWTDQVPLLSWLRLRGRCRACGEAIPSRYAVAELLVIACTVVVIAQPWSFLLTLTWLLFVPVGVALAFIDLRHKRLPNILTLRAAAMIVVLLALDAIPDGWPDLLVAIECAAALFTLYLLMNLLTGGAMGMGDVKLALSIGLLTGYLGWFHAVLATLIAFLAGGIISAVLLVSRRAGRKSTIPFGPFMLLGLIMVIGLFSAMREALLA
jgi:leader peptidase (prepilin peptidase)/N-methyltransferase